MRTATRVGDCASADFNAGETSKGLERLCDGSVEVSAGALRGDFPAGAAWLDLPGEALPTPLCGGIVFGGDNGIVGFKIDLNCGGRTG